MPKEPPTNLIFVVALLLILGVLSFLLFLPFLTYILLGLLIVYLTFPLFTRLAKWTKRPRLAAMIVLLTVVLAVVVPTGFLGWRLLKEAQGFAAGFTPEAAEAQIDSMAAGILRLVGQEPTNVTYGKAVVEAVVPAAQGYVRAHVADLLGIVTAFFVGMFILAFVIYYGLIDGPRLVGYLTEVLPLSGQQSTQLLGDVRRTLDAVFLGQIVGAVFQGVLGAIGLLLFGVPGVLVWGLVMMILSVIPFLGAFLVWAPAGVWLLATGHTWQGIGLLAWGAILVSNVDNFVKPLLVSAKAQIHPVVVLVGVLGGLLVFGVMGFVLGPLVLSLFVAVLDFWREDYLPAYREAHWQEELQEAMAHGGGLGGAFGAQPLGPSDERER